MANHDIDKIRSAIAQQEGRVPRAVIRPGRAHRPHLRPAPRTRGQFALALLSIVLTFMAMLFAMTAGQVAAFRIGDHAQSAGTLRHAMVVEFRLLPWITIVAVLTAAVARPYQAVLAAFGAGIVENDWWLHLPSHGFPRWFADLVDGQRTLLEHHDPWQAFGILLASALVAMAWAERTQAT
jgi:transposase